MARQLTIDIPEAVTSHFVIATATPPRDPAAEVRQRLARCRDESLPRLAAELLETPLLEIRVDRAAWSDFAADMAATAKRDGAALARLERATHHLVVANHAPPLAQPEHAQAARSVARILAGISDGMIYDARCEQLLPRRFRDEPEPPDFRLADHWLSAFVIGDPPGQPPRHTSGGRSGDGSGCRSSGGGARPTVHVETGGLHRFGLPDLVLSGASPMAWLRPLNLLRGVAVRMLDEHFDWLRHNPGDTPRHVGTHLWIEAREAQAFQADEALARPASARVLVRLTRAPDECPGAPPFLRIGPPADFAGNRREWLETVVAPAIPSVTGWPRTAAA
jgi:hypothetical protein